MTAVPKRVRVTVLGATATVTRPLPVPELPYGKVIQLRLVPAVHVQPGVAVTLTTTCPPVAPKYSLGGEIEKLHTIGGAKTKSAVFELPL